MTPDERQACLGLVTVPGRGRALSPRRFLKRVGARDGGAWAAEQVEDAARRRDEDDLELALVAAAALGDSAVPRPLLRQVLGEDWHHSHENIVTVIQRAASPDDVPALVRAATWVPTYLEFDESRALARKAIHAVATIAGSEADAALVPLAGHEDDTLARLAVRLLEGRSASAQQSTHTVTEARCRALLASVASHADAWVVEEPDNLLRAGEWGLAFEELCDNLHEGDVAVAPEEVREIESLGRALDSPRLAWRKIRDLRSE